MFNRVFGRGVENVLSNLRKVIIATPTGHDFPIQQLNAELARMNFNTEFNDNFIKEYLNSVYPIDYIRFSVLYEDQLWDAVNIQQDHIFPKALFTQSNPDFSFLPKEKQESFKSLVNKAANLQPLMDEENNNKRAKSFNEWLKSRDIGFRKTHLIPDDDEILSFDNFDKFVAAREVLITHKLRNVI